MNPPFHEGELAAQRLAGVLGAGGAIRAQMPDQHRDFFAQLPFVLAATVDADGAPRACVLHGAPGFIHSPDPVTLAIDCASALEAGRPVGLLGIDLATRRRNRANGVVRSNAGGRLVVEVRESFGNCPQHIRVREVHGVAPGQSAVTGFSGLDQAARRIVAAADTLFVASTGGVHGVDISHRGGAPGFARIEGDSLRIADLKGNRYFNTLGNMLLDPRVALLFIDFAQGDVLELNGRAQIDWASDAEGTRSWRFACAHGSLTRSAVALRWTARG